MFARNLIEISSISIIDLALEVVSIAHVPSIPAAV